MKDRILQIAARELGSKDGIFAAARIEDVFCDSLEWLSFIQCLRKEIGPLSNEAATKAERFSDLIKAYA